MGAVEKASEGNNLVLVDEGCRGAGVEMWKARRPALGEDGFTFEYSATFGQAPGRRCQQRRLYQRIRQVRAVRFLPCALPGRLRKHHRILNWPRTVTRRLTEIPGRPARFVLRSSCGSTTRRRRSLGCSTGAPAVGGPSAARDRERCPP